MKLDTFFATHPVFRVAELDTFLNAFGGGNVGTRQSLLSYHERQGHVLRLRRGLYASVPAGANPQTLPVDPFLLASRLAEDAVLAYHTALAFHGAAYSIRRQLTVLSEQPQVRPLRFRDETYSAVTPSAALVHAGLSGFDVETAERSGLPIKVTTLERTLVDVLDRPLLGGGWEEIWRSFEDAPYLDIDALVSYTLLLQNATTAAKVGYFLETHREALMVEEAQLQRLREHRPRQPRYMQQRPEQQARLVSAWNLMVPLAIQRQTWREVA